MSIRKQRVAQRRMNVDANHAALRAIAESINRKAVERGFEAMSEATIEEAVATMARDVDAFNFIDDQEARLGLHVADERQDLTMIYADRGFPSRIPLPAKGEHDAED